MLFDSWFLTELVHFTHNIFVDVSMDFNSLYLLAAGRIKSNMIRFLLAVAKAKVFATSCICKMNLNAIAKVKDFDCNSPCQRFCQCMYET